MSDAVLVTGASGYLGCNILRDFIERGYKVRGLTRCEASADLVKQLGAEPVRGDILDLASLEAAMGGCGALVHAAADTDHGRSSKKQELTNLKGTQNVYDAAHAAGIKRAVHISTEAVLMDGRPLRTLMKPAQFLTSPRAAIRGARPARNGLRLPRMVASWTS